MRIPEVRRKLAKAADDLRAGKNPKLIARRLDIFTTELWRRKPRRRAGAPVIRRRLTPELKMEIRAYVRKHPKQDWQEVGNHFNVNPGRISEVMKGHRK
jgi:hypothetical protein